MNKDIVLALWVHPCVTSCLTTYPTIQEARAVSQLLKNVLPARLLPLIEKHLTSVRNNGRSSSLGWLSSGHVFHINVTKERRWVEDTFGLGSAHLFVHEYIDEGVDDSATLSHDGGHHSQDGGDKARVSKGGHHSDHAVRHPAEQVTHHCSDHHEQDVELSPPRRWLTDPPHLRGNYHT